MDAEVRNSLEAITNLLYLVRLAAPRDVPAYLDLADQQVNRLIESLSKSQSRRDS
jgi:hypothetical protein